MLLNAKKRNIERWISFNNKLTITLFYTSERNLYTQLFNCRWWDLVLAHMCPAQSINLHNIGLPVFVRCGSLIVHVCGKVVRDLYVYDMLSVTCGQHSKHSDMDQTSQVYVTPGKLCPYPSFLWETISWSWNGLEMSIFNILYLLHLCCILCRALQRSGTSIPECRRLELLDTVAQYCDCSAEDVTDEMIQQASEVNTKSLRKYILHTACVLARILI